MGLGATDNDYSVSLLLAIGKFAFSGCRIIVAQMLGFRCAIRVFPEA